VSALDRVDGSDGILAEGDITSDSVDGQDVKNVDRGEVLIPRDLLHHLTER
jgi:hypothetical protein